jgi:Osmosensitive K+ channel histidine kinase
MDRLKTIFLSNMSHELNTPMSGIMGFSELLLQDLEDKNQRDMAMYIHKSSKRLNETLTSLLDISKIQAQNLDIKFIPVDIVGTLKECRLIYNEPAIAKGLIINFSSSMEKIIIKGDSNILTK